MGFQVLFLRKILEQQQVLTWWICGFLQTTGLIFERGKDSGLFIYF